MTEETERSMQKNWMGIALLVMSAELAALLVLVIVWLPDQLEAPAPAARGEDRARVEERLVEIENSLKQLRFELKQAGESSGTSIETGKKLETMLDRIDELGTMIYEFDQDTTRNLMRMQSNLMRRLSVLGGGAGPPKDREELIPWLEDGRVTLDEERSEIRFKALIASPRRPLETVIATEGGPLHEALFEAQVRPWAVRAGLEALGLKPGKPADFVRGVEATGDLVEILISWDGLEKPIPLSELILDVGEEGAMSGAEWVFTASGYDSSFTTGEQIYIPDESRVVVSLTNNFGHLSVVSCRHRSSGNEMNWQVKLDRLPEDPEAVVTVHMRRRSS